LKENWADMYQYCAHNKPPESWWKKAIDEDGSLYAEMKEKAKYRT
jgi:hypothetical protein